MINSRSIGRVSYQDVIRIVSIYRLLSQTWAEHVTIREPAAPTDPGPDTLCDLRQTLCVSHPGISSSLSALTS